MRDPEERAEAVVPEEVNRLLDERSQVQGWLERLSELKDEATPEVYARVESDYQGRLEEVSGRLSSHRADLEGSLDAQRDRVAGLQEDRDERAAELEEAKLRFSVGEYDDEEWERRREAAQGAIEELDGRLEEARAALEELEGVLAALPGGDAAASWRSAAAAPGEARPAEAEEPVATEREGEEASARRSQGWLDELKAPSAETEAETVTSAEVGDRETAEPESRTALPDEAEASPPERPAAEASEPSREEVSERPAAEPPASADDDFLDELEFLESLSLEDSKRFDAVSAMLEGEEEAEEGEGREGGG